MGGTPAGRAGVPEASAGAPGAAWGGWAARVYGWLRRHRRWLAPLAVVLLLGQMAVGMVTAAAEQTPTIDEPVYVGTAAVYLHDHSLAYNPEHPPLGKLLIAAGVAAALPHFDASFTGDQGQLGRHLLYESGNDPWRLMLWARLPVIVATLLFGLVVFAFARELAGVAGALVALALYAFSPDLIAHGSLATLDVPAAGFVLLSAWLMWRARRRPRPYLPLAGAALGAAVATKMNALPAVSVLLALAVLSAWTGGRRSGDDGGTRAGTARVLAAGAGRAAVAGVVAVAVVWASYLVVDPHLRTPPGQTAPAVHGLRGALVGLLPLPGSYLDGMRIQFGLEARPWQGFLFGHVYTGARWYYLPVALLVKTPLGALALWAAGAVALVAVRRLRRAAPYVLAPPAVLLAAAMHSSRDFGTRYALFLPMFLAVAAAATISGVAATISGTTGTITGATEATSRATGTATGTTDATPHTTDTATGTTEATPRVTGAVGEPLGRSVRRARWRVVVVAALAVFVVVSSLRTFPYYLPYSNEAFGGPAKTHLRLHDSNVDWGQDLGRLADRLRARYPGKRVWLVYKGSGVPAFYGIHAADPRGAPPERVHGLLVVSDSAAAKAKGRLAALIRSARPVGEVGHSITLYRR